MKNNFQQVIGTLAALMIAIASVKADEKEWVEQATSPDQETALQAQASLRDAGPEGLQALEQRYAGEIAAHQKGVPGDDQWKRIEAALNRVGAQYDNYASGLYWYTDLEKAKAAAQASGKPILSLRLLGRLDEDLSCANSRFFRTTLYPNAAVNEILRDKFILHWESVRPVPLVTIDFGDGRKLVRTITGNSIHYILTPDGQVVDALPGLYGARAFADELQSAAQFAARYREKDFSIAQYQDATRNRLLAAWKKDLAATDNVSESSVPIADASLQPMPSVPLQASDLYESDATAETSLEFSTSEARWQLIAREHLGDATLDDKTREVVTLKFPTAATVAPLTTSKMLVESPMLKAIRNLQTTAALDSVRNNYLLRTKILAFLESPPARNYSLSEVNDWVYARIFLTPKDDPWLGLAPQNVFSGIAQNGETP
jgi:hypothetical protein